MLLVSVFVVGPLNLSVALRATSTTTTLLLVVVGHEASLGLGQSGKCDSVAAIGHILVLTTLVVLVILLGVFVVVAHDPPIITHNESQSSGFCEKSEDFLASQHLVELVELRLVLLETIRVTNRLVEVGSSRACLTKLRVTVCTHTKVGVNSAVPKRDSKALGGLVVGHTLEGLACGEDCVHAHIIAPSCMKSRLGVDFFENVF